jgi:hypothetical protein
MVWPISPPLSTLSAALPRRPVHSSQPVRFTARIPIAAAASCLVSLLSPKPLELQLSSPGKVYRLASATSGPPAFMSFSSPPPFHLHPSLPSHLQSSPAISSHHLPHFNITFNPIQGAAWTNGHMVLLETRTLDALLAVLSYPILSYPTLSHPVLILILLFSLLLSVSVQKSPSLLPRESFVSMISVSG